MLHLGSWLQRLRRAFTRLRRPLIKPTPRPTVRPGFDILEDRTLPAGTGTGLLGQYFSDQTLSNLQLTRIDPAINFNWSTQAPAAGMATTNYSVRWSGQLEALYSEATMIYTKSDDGVRLWIDGKLVIDSWTDHPLKEDATKVNLLAGQKYSIQLEYHQNTGSAVAQLFWLSPSMNWSVIPTSQLYPAQPPTASLNAPNVTTTGGSAYDFTVTYRDDGTLNLASLDDNDVRVSGPNGFGQAARFIAVTATGSNTWTATYRITPPGGSWDNADNGTYSVALQPGQVSDTTKVLAPGGTLGSFAVNLVSDWFSQNLLDANLASQTRTLAADGVLSRNDMIALLRAVEPGGVSSAELSDLRTLVKNGSSLGMPVYVQNLAGKVVNGDPANARYQGQPLGNLYAGSSGTQLETLISKWFLGTDHPAVDASGLTYTAVAGTLFGNGPLYTDVKQGRVSNCYFVAAMAGVAHRLPQMVRDAFIDNGDGTYTVRFWNGTKADYVTVDRYLPTTSSGTLYYAGMGWSASNTANKLWAPLWEKAYAQLAESGWSRPTAVNAYTAIRSGWEGTAVQHLTGKSASWRSIEASSLSLNALVTTFQSGKMVFLDSNSATATGIVANHIYVMVGYNATTQVFSLYNPWGSQVQLSWSQVAANFGTFSYSM
jgi:hypothetical protein